MDGPHDLGGRQGFGAVDVNEKEEAFHEPWEGRVYGLVRSMTRADDWSIDWFRHCRELIAPLDYLTRPYYDQWLQCYAAMLINSGIANMDEIVSGKASGVVPDLPAPMTGEYVQKTAKRIALNSEREANMAPAFAPGDQVKASMTGSVGHTRLPGYLRGRCGVVEAFRGVHILPDASAHSDERAEPLYTVGFEASELWPEARGSRDRIFADMWESYLERT